MAIQQLANNDNNNDEIAIDIPGSEELINAAANELGRGSSRLLARPLFWVGSWTLVIFVNRIVFKLPPGAFFEDHMVAYYFILLGVFIAGVAEVYAAILLSSAQDGGRVRAIAAPLLCASVVLLVALVALGGSPVPVMG